MIKNAIKIFMLTCAVSASAMPQTAVIPIVELKTRGLLGGVRDGRWVPPSRIAPKTGSSFEFVLVGPTGVEEGGVTLAKQGETEDVCQDFFRYEFDLQQDHGVAIGTAAKWDLLPRPVQKVDPNVAVYRAAVASFLKKKKILKPVVKIAEAYRVDLEGDGVDEVVLSATYFRNGLSSSAAVGDYSFVLLRKASGKVVTDYLLKGDFITRRIDFGAPTENRISAIADLNGDGRLEIVLNGAYYEGEFAAAFEMRNGRPVEIKEFEIRCGV
jgi:hypothetical protein